MCRKSEGNRSGPDHWNVGLRRTDFTASLNIWKNVFTSLRFFTSFSRKVLQNGDFGFREKANGSAFLLLLSARLTQGCKECAKRSCFDIDFVYISWFSELITWLAIWSMDLARKNGVKSVYDIHRHWASTSSWLHISHRQNHWSSYSRCKYINRAHCFRIAPSPYFSDTL
jgi:hypothetical protein